MLPHQLVVVLQLHHLLVKSGVMATLGGRWRSWMLQGGEEEGMNEGRKGEREGGREGGREEGRERGSEGEKEG